MRKNYKQVFYPHEVIMDAVEYANANPRETPILFLDEINRTTSDVTSAALSIPTMRRIGSVKLPTNLKVMIAGNDKGNVTSLDEASISRFVLYRVEPDCQTFLGLSDSLNPYIANVLKKNPAFIFCKSIDVTVTGKKDDDGNDIEETFSIDDIIADGEGMSQITTPRTINALSDWLNEFDNAEIIQLMATPVKIEGMDSNVFMEGIVGHAGYTNFSICVEDEIRNNLNTVSSHTASKTPKAPGCYMQLKQQPDMNTLQSYVASLNNAELSASIVYALYEKVDNKTILIELARVANKLEPNDMAMLMNLIASEDYDKENYDVVIKSGGKIGTLLEVYSNN